MKRVLVTGAGGFIGRALVRYLCDCGFDVRLALRSHGVDTDNRCERATVGGIGPTTEWVQALHRVEGVVHLAARVHIVEGSIADPLTAFREVNVGGTRRLAEQAAVAGVKRFGYVSSIGVLGNETTHEPFTETSRPRPQTPYALSKWEAEQALWAVARKTGLQITIVRPPLVYGPGNPGNFLRLLRSVDKGWPFPLGSVRNQRSFIGIDNLVNFLSVCLAHPRAANEIFLVSDIETISTPDLIHRLASFLGSRAWLFPFPVTLLRFGARMLDQSDMVARLVGSLVVTSDKARQLLGWMADTPLNKGLEQTVKWYKEIYEKSP